MSCVFLDMAISLDGFISGPDGGDQGLHDWYFAGGAATQIKDELLRDIGVIVMGHGAFGSAPDGFDTPYHIPHVILTHEARSPVRRGGASFQFETGGVALALSQARALAGERDVCIAGGAQTAQQFLAAGLIEEVQLHIAPVIFGDGLRLFESPGPLVRLERIRVVESTHATHVRFRVKKP
jgi:dihydrofolate reductase